VNPAAKTRVLIVDDSALVRCVARSVLSADPEIEVVDTAADPYEARDKIALHHPDVLTLDLEMPRMDGLTFLRLLMEQRPLPVVVLSSLSQLGSESACEALRLGAVDVVGKPPTLALLADLGVQLTAKVKAAARARLRPAPAALERPRVPPPFVPSGAAGRSRDPRAIILLGASTGGVEALHEVLAPLPADLPAIAVVQHIPALFSRTFAERLNRICALEVREAVDGERLAPGTALIAPGNFHLALIWNRSHYVARVTGGPPVWHQRPAVDLLFKSAAEAGAGHHCIAGVLTGMGRDGAEGLLRLRERGAATFAQDEKTSVVYGMPRAARENGAAQIVLPLEPVAPFLIPRFETRTLAPVAGAAP